MDVNDSGTVKLGEVCTFYCIEYPSNITNCNIGFFLFPGLAKVAVKHNMQQRVPLGSAQRSE